MEMYIRLIMMSLIPAALSVLLYLVEKKTKFGKLPYMLRQVIIGVLFGGVAIIETEFGVPIDGATANARDAAPLCAGLLFGGPAGIIAGVIGGTERWFAALWGAGEYSRLACSVSTALAGLYAAAIRNFLFDNRRPTWGFAAVAGVVIEVFHMLILFLTHINDAQKAYDIVKICTLPMIFANSIGVVVAIAIIRLLSNSIKSRVSHHKNISQVVQSSLLMCIIVMYIITTGFVFILQTQNAYNDFEELMDVSFADIQKSIKATTDTDLLNAAHAVEGAVENNESKNLSEIAANCNVDAILIVDSNGFVTEASDILLVGMDITKDEKLYEFATLTGKIEEQHVQSASYFGVGDEYAGLATDDGCLLVMMSAEHFQSRIATDIAHLTDNMHIGSNGYFIICDSQLNILSSLKGSAGEKLSASGIRLEAGKLPGGIFESTVYGVDSYCKCKMMCNYYVVGVQSVEDTMLDRDNEAYINSFNQVLAYAVLFAMIYHLIKRLVVNNIRKINASLGKIINGDLSVQVDVRGCDEFASLSDDINSTVTTLQHYIDEAAARIDKELEFARNIQHSALPTALPPQYQLPQFDIYATMDAAKEVGGDFYDYYMIDSENLAFLIADVSGKGIPAAMFMMRAKTMIKNFAEMGIPLDEAFNHANAELCEGNDADMFVTAWMGVLNVKTGHVQFVSAGHNPPLIYRKDQGYEYIKSKTGFVLAAMDCIVYKIQEFDLKAGDKLFLYTDGITEATSVETELYGEERLRKYLNANPELSCADTLRGVTADVNKFVNGAEQFDDMTMVALRYNGVEA